MDKIRNKYEIILGFVTLVLSFSAFKDELKLIVLELGYCSISVADLFLYCVYGFAICLYFYIIEQVVRDTNIGTYKIFDYAIKFAFFLFCLILLSPILIILNIIVYKFYFFIADNQNKRQQEIFLTILNIITTAITVAYSLRYASYYSKFRKNQEQNEMIEKEIKEIEIANKLFEDGYYSHSILELFKVIETHLYKKITAKGFRISQHRFDEILKLAVRENFVDDKDFKYIVELRAMRNISAHSDVKFTKEMAEKALKFVKRIINSN